jgi:IclR family pca regulon transcriptional regulator
MGEASISSTGAGTKTTRTLEKGLMILNLFDSEHSCWTLKGITEATGISMPTALRLTRTLEKAHYLRHDGRTRGYELGPAIYRAASAPRSHTELIRVAHPHLQSLTWLTTETTALGIWEHGWAHIIDLVLTPRPFKPVIHVGTAIPGLATLHAQIAVAFGPDNVLEAALALDHPHYTDYTLTDPAQLREQIEYIRREYMAFALETMTLGVCSVAAPVFGPHGEVVASVALLAPVERFGPIEMRNHGAAVLREANLVSQELGWTEGLDRRTTK